MDFLNLDTDVTLGGVNASNTKISSQKAIKGYADRNFIPSGTVITIPTDYATLTEAIASLDGKYSDGAITIAYANPEGTSTYTIDTTEEIDISNYSWNIPQIIVEGNNCVFNPSIKAFYLKKNITPIIFQNMVFTNNSDTFFRVFHLEDMENTFIQSCTFNNCYSTDAWSGIIAIYGGSFEIKSCEFNYTTAITNQVNDRYFISAERTRGYIRNNVFNVTVNNFRCRGVQAAISAIVQCRSNTFSLGYANSGNGTAYHLATGALLSTSGDTLTAAYEWLSDNTKFDKGYIKG